MKDEAGHLGHRDQRRGNHRRRAGPLTAALTIGLMAIAPLAAACGGQSGPGVAGAGPGGSGASPGSSGHGSTLAYSRCMRSHGITSFPDPDSNGTLALDAGPGTGIDPNSPQYKAADRACKPLLPVPDARQAARNRPALLRYAKCMRAHGVTDFPDPKPGGGIQIQSSPGSDLDQNSPVYKAADRACKHYTSGLGGGEQSLNSSGSGGGGS